MKNKFEIEIMYSSVKIVMAKSFFMKLMWCIRHDVVTLIFKALYKPDPQLETE